MSAGISFDITGKAEAVYNTRPAWHGLGKVFESSPGNRLTSERAILEANLGWAVEKRGLIMASQSYGNLPVPGFFATVRSDNESVLGVVGERYKVFQNTEAFAFLDSLVQDGIMEYESAFALQGGSRIVLLARLPKADDIGEDDTLNRYLFLNTTHDGSGAISMIPTNVRVQCQNMADAVLASRHKAKYSVSIRHTDKMGDRLDAARDYILSVEEAFREYADNSRRLMERKTQKEDVAKYVGTLYPVPKNETPEESADVFGAIIPGVTQKAMTIHANKLASLSDSFRHPSNQLPAMKGTWWQLYNAISYDVDHNSRTRGRTDSARRENRFLNVSEGIGAKLKAKAFKLALEMSA